jgi:hypothetical protein
MVKFILASLVILVVMVAWLYVQDLYRRFAQRNPELGPFRGERGCDGSCSCQQGSCSAPEPNPDDRVIALDLMALKGKPSHLRRE